MMERIMVLVKLMSDERQKSYDIVVRQYHKIFIACVTLKVVQPFYRMTKVVRYRTCPTFLVWYRRNAAMWLVRHLLFLNKMD